MLPWKTWQATVVGLNLWCAASEESLWRIFITLRQGKLPLVYTFDVTAAAAAAAATTAAAATAAVQFPGRVVTHLMKEVGCLW